MELERELRSSHGKISSVTLYFASLSWKVYEMGHCRILNSRKLKVGRTGTVVVIADAVGHFCAEYIGSSLSKPALGVHCSEHGTHERDWV